MFPEQTYVRFVCGLKLIGGQFVPPSAPGANATNWVVSNGVKMQPILYGFPSVALPLNSFLSAHWVANASPVGVGCVGQVFCCLFCGTFFSGIGRRGCPVSRSSMSTQPVLQASATPWRPTAPPTL